jgi:hypothetical protein
MSSTIQFFRVDLDLLQVGRVDEDGRPDPGGRTTMAALLADLAARQDWDLLDELMEQPEDLGLMPVGDSFRGAWAFFGDVAERVPSLTGSAWLEALSEGQARLPASALGEPALAGLQMPGWVVLDAADVEQLVSAVRAALAADPKWAAAGHGNGPEWQLLSDDLERQPAQYLLALLL